MVDAIQKDVGLYEKGLDYHSFRGGVTTKLTAANVSLDVRNELLGHEGASVDERVYRMPNPKFLMALVPVRGQGSIR